MAVGDNFGVDGSEARRTGELDNAGLEAGSSHSSSRFSITRTWHRFFLVVKERDKDLQRQLL